MSDDWMEKWAEPLTVKWPPPREDPEQEPSEPWARLRDRVEDERDE